MGINSTVLIIINYTVFGIVQIFVKVKKDYKKTYFDKGFRFFGVNLLKLEIVYYLIQNRTPF